MKKNETIQKKLKTNNCFFPIFIGSDARFLIKTSATPPERESSDVPWNVHIQGKKKETKRRIREEENEKEEKKENNKRVVRVAVR